MQFAIIYQELKKVMAFFTKESFTGVLFYFPHFKNYLILVLFTI